MYYLADFCCVCLLFNQNLKNICLKDEDGIEVEKKLKAILLEFHNIKPHIPQHICNNCLQNVNYIYEFRLKWLENITTVNKYLQKLELYDGLFRNISVTVIDVRHTEHQIKPTNQNIIDTSIVKCDSILKTEEFFNEECIIKKELEETFSSTTLKSEFINEETAESKNVFQVNTNFTEEYNQTNIIKLEIAEENCSVQDVKQLLFDERVEENSIDYKIITKDHKNAFNNLQTPYEIFQVFNEDVDIKEDGNTSTAFPEIESENKPDASKDEDCDSDPNYENDDESSESSLSSTSADESSVKATELQAPVSSTATEYKGVNSSLTENTAATSTADSTTTTATTPLQKFYKCPECNKPFLNLSCLRTHLRSHTGEKRLTCDVCGKNFSRQSNLNQHKKNHNQDRPYKCTACDKDFTRRNHFARHMLTHTGEKPFACEVCSFRTCTKVELRNHMRKHSDDKPYKCHLCKYKSKHSYHLKLHMRNHTGDKPYKCEHCQKTFVARNNLNRHLKRKH